MVLLQIGKQRYMETRIIFEFLQQCRFFWGASNQLLQLFSVFHEASTLHISCNLCLGENCYNSNFPSFQKIDLYNVHPVSEQLSRLADEFGTKMVNYFLHIVSMLNDGWLLFAIGWFGRPRLLIRWVLNFEVGIVVSDECKEKFKQSPLTIKEKEIGREERIQTRKKREKKGERTEYYIYLLVSDDSQPFVLLQQGVN